MGLSVVEHPLAADLLGRLRSKSTPPDEFRDLSDRLTTILVLEATRNLGTRDAEVETPLEKAVVRRLSCSVAAVAILRAGLGMLASVTRLLPEVSVGYIGMERDENTAVAKGYYCKLPTLRGRLCLLLDPMLATGGSAVQAVDLLKSEGGETITMVCIVAAPEGRDRLLSAHPDVEVFTAALDRELSSQKFILPGLGDFGDRLYGTGGV